MPSRTKLVATSLLTMLSLAPALVLAAVTLQAPPTASVGGPVTVTVSGSSNARDFVTIVAKGAAEGSYDGWSYVASAAPITLTAPTSAGAYEVRVLGADAPYPTLARRPLQVQAAVATLDGPTQVAAGASFQVRWTGPNNDRDYVALGAADRPYIVYAYTSSGSPLTLTAPDAAGSYELRYFLGAGDTIIARRPITVGAVSAAVTVPAQVAAGAGFTVRWTGPDNARDFVTIVPAGAPAGTYLDYAYTADGNPAKLRAPDVAGKYEVRYLTGSSYLTIASAALSVAPVQGSVQGPAQVVAGTTVSVRWTGPNNPQDYVTIVPKGAREGASAEYAWTASGNPVRINAPLAAGDYEIRYALAQSNATLARAPLAVTPAALEPGFLQVTAAAPAAADRAVQVIVDASGSMLQKLGAQRRIDIARQTLTRLVTTTIPRGTPFALRVFGREVDSCQSDLVTPLAPLDPAAMAKTVGALEAKNNARTAIGASLSKVTEDLRAASGARIVILLTDGEETCGGDPGAAIEQLRKAGIKPVVNIVGFAIDDAKLAASFRQWASLGNGAYFDARDAKSLDAALTAAVQPRFELLDAKGLVVARGMVGGEPVQVMPGSYQLQVRGSAGGPVAVIVKPRETSVVRR